MSPQLIFVPPVEVTPEDIALCERLIESYHHAIENPANAPGPMWDVITREHCFLLVQSLDTKDPKYLAELLAKMFGLDFVSGISHGPVASPDRLATHCVEGLVRLAEYLGIVHVRNPEQGGDDTLTAGLDVLVARIELALSRSIGFPEVGAPYGVRSAGALVTPESPEQIYVAQRILSLGRWPLSIVEIGGGYGGLAYRLLSGGVDDYTIIDLPLAGVLQGYFLTKALGPRFKWRTLPPSEIPYPPTGTKDGHRSDHQSCSGGAGGRFVVNQNGMPEMGSHAITRYLAWATGHADYFYSYNHEAFAPPQIRVSEIVKFIGGFKKLSRNPSWLRPGYVEEVYGTERNQR